MGKNILITGGAGFIGSHLANHHLELGDKVWVVDNFSEGSMENIKSCLNNPLFTLDRADVRTWQHLDRAVEWADCIYEMAATLGQRNVIAHPIETITNNTEGCSRILNTMGRLNANARLLVASTSSVYYHLKPGEDGALHETMPLTFIPTLIHHDPYPISKLLNEVLALSYVHEKGLFCTIARLFNTIGVRQSGRYGMVIPTFINQAFHGEPITVYGSGLQTRSFTNVHDAVTGMSLMLNTPSCSGEIFNVGNEQECTILETARLIQKKTGGRSEIRHLTYKEAYGIDFEDVEQRHPSIAKLARFTGYKPAWTLEATIDEILEEEWLKLKNAKAS